MEQEVGPAWATTRYPSSLGQAHIWAMSPGQIPGELHVVAEVKRVSAEGEMVSLVPGVGEAVQVA